MTFNEKMNEKSRNVQVSNERKSKLRRITQTNKGHSHYYLTFIVIVQIKHQNKWLYSKSSIYPSATPSSPVLPLFVDEHPFVTQPCFLSFRSDYTFSRLFTVLDFPCLGSFPNRREKAKPGGGWKWVNWTISQSLYSFRNLSTIFLILTIDCDRLTHDSRSLISYVKKKKRPLSQSENNGADLTVLR